MVIISMTDKYFTDWLILIQMMQGISYYDKIGIVLNSVFHISYPDSKYQFARICNELGNTIFIISNLSHGSFHVLNKILQNHFHWF